MILQIFVVFIPVSENPVSALEKIKLTLTDAISGKIKGHH
jgi:hypothetical protein